jgi:1-acyl-sn-glycerol-3-phosphate acyltransferase
VFVANHHSHVDTPLLLSTIPDRWRHKIVVGAAADYFFGTRVGSAFAALVIGAIPIERTKVGRKSADLARSLIDEGWSLLIFPEGGRSPDGWGQPFRGGAAYIAMRCGVPVVPIHVEGTGRILRKGKSRPTRASVTLTFGAPLVPLEREDARKFAARIEAVAVLADEATTDRWQARRRAHAGTTPRSAAPRAAPGAARGLGAATRRSAPSAAGRRLIPFWSRSLATRRAERHSTSRNPLGAIEASTEGSSTQNSVRWPGNTCSDTSTGSPSTERVTRSHTSTGEPTGMPRSAASSGSAAAAAMLCVAPPRGTSMSS